MSKAVYIVVGNCADPNREEEFNNWYQVHARDILTVPGVIAGTRYKLHPQTDPAVMNPGDGQYLAIWEIDAGDPADVVANIWKGSRQWSAEGRGTDLLRVPYHAIYEPITERMTPLPLPAEAASQ